MLTLLTAIHIIACLLLIFFVLLQDAKGGGVFGAGSSQSILGPTGATTFFAKLTRYTAIVFAATSLILTIKTTPSNTSAVDDFTAPAAPTSEKAAPKVENTTDPAPSTGDGANRPAPATPENK